MTSVIIPAHNEAAGIATTLAAVSAQLEEADEVIVVCNGCTDDTAGIARAQAPRAEVLEIATASKTAALDVGDARASTFPRLYLDADVELTPGSVDALVAALDGERRWLVAPRARYVLSDSSAAVRSYYRIWSRLPSVGGDTVAKGCYAVNARGRACFDRFAGVLGDDHLVRDAVPEDRRGVVGDAVSVVDTPRTLGAVVRRKVRTLEGNAALDGANDAGVRRARSRERQWAGVVKGLPPLVLDLPVFLGVGIVARGIAEARSRTGSGGTWLRDDSR